MRAYISLNIDAENKENIRKIQHILKIKLDKPFLVRFENPKNFHLTLFFIGETNEEKLELVYNKLKLELENKYGELNFHCSGINAFPDLKNPRVLFLNCRSKENKIFEPAEKIKNILCDFGFTQDKNFHPHITLARIKGKIKLKNTDDIKTDVIFSVSKISIMESTISTNGGEHKELFLINL
ncbi:MAG: RNA 2',3'-cyclic phosphodiesterase [Ignavibacteria bacterium]|nr:RNA 2',3'-cyclic phosphodiesterase [Ignavibacteria bacterium]